ncbi:MAG: recombinase family protein [Clostridiales bacterium]|jgi:site-specific DNA recombinase|nr:recombinase family protein [Clostridiales bacterium]
MAKPKTPNNANERKIAIYVRKSKITESGKSIEIQKEKCLALAFAQFSCTEADTIIYEDNGKSGFYADRPAYKKMLRDIEANKIKAVICYKIDRISRRTVDLLNLVSQMEQKGIVFVSVSDRELDTSTRTGKIMVSLLSAIAEFERDIIAERITDNMHELAKEGRWLGGICPLGYTSQKERLTVNGRKTTMNHLVPNPEKQKTVRRIFELFLSNSSLTGTAEILNEEGHTTDKNKNFTLIAVKNILQNPVYAIADDVMFNYFTQLSVPVWAKREDFDGVRGIMAYNKTEQTKEIDSGSKALDPKYTQKTLRRDVKDWIVSVGKHEGQISGEKWTRAQKIIAEIAANNSARPKETSKALLSGLVICENCQSRMFVRCETGRQNPDKTPRFKYICDIKYRKKGNCVKSPNIKGFELDNCVIEHICKAYENEGALNEEILCAKNALLNKAAERGEDLILLKKQLAQIENDIQIQIKNLRTAPETIKHAIYADIETLTKESESKKKLVCVINNDKKNTEGDNANAGKVAENIVNFTNILEFAPYELKLRLVREIVETIAVKSGVVHIYLKGAIQ